MKALLALLLLAASVCAWGQDSTEVAPEAAPVAAPDTAWREGVRTRLDALMLDPLLQTSQLGLMVYDLTDTCELYAHGARQLLRPASSMKVVTAITALATLGADYKFATTLYLVGTDAYVVGGMDPQLSAADLRAMADSLHRAVGDTLRGRLYMDTSMVADGPYGWGWCWDDDEARLTPLAYEGHDTFARHWLTTLRRAGLVIPRDSVYTAALPPKAPRRELCRRLRPLDDVLHPMLKSSHNLSAESVFYALAAAGGKRHATRRDAERHTAALIRRMHLDPSPYTVADGSGLSLYNYVSAELLVGFLRTAYADSTVYAHLLPHLPIAGRDGTLRKRLAGRKVYAKTGTVTGVSSLTGYCEAPNGHHLAFAILNTGLVKAASGRAFQDKVCEALTR